MSPYDPNEGPSITGWIVQRWESSPQPVVLQQIFGNPTSSFGGQALMLTVWLSKVDTSIQPTNDFKSHQAAATTATTDARKTPDSRTLARIVYSAHGGEIAVAFLRGGVHIFSGSNFCILSGIFKSKTGVGMYSSIESSGGHSGLGVSPKALLKLGSTPNNINGMSNLNFQNFKMRRR